MKRLALAALAVAGLLATATVSAHHSFSATYISDKEVKVEGEMVVFMFRNPHSFVQVMAPDDKGQMQRWSIEWAPASQLAATIKHDTLKVGDRLIVTGNPGRIEEEHRLRMRSILRPSDGWKWGGTFE